MAQQRDIELAGGSGVAIGLAAGEALRLTNTHGSQVVDTWAVASVDPSEFLSVEHTRRMNARIYPRQGDIFWSNRRSRMLLLETDRFEGTHDTLVACCDPWLYAHYGAPPGHANCRDNFLAALAAEGITPTTVPNPVNLWMNVPVEGESMHLTAPVSRAGDFVVLRALMDVHVVLSACPMDITPVNGEDRTLKPVHYAILPAGA